MSELIGTITDIDTVKGLSILIDGEETPTKKNYSYLNSYVPAKGHRVLILEISGTYVIIGAITNAYENAGIARVAEKSTEATNARYVRNSGSITGDKIEFYATYSGLRVYGNGFNFTLKP